MNISHRHRWAAFTHIPEFRVGQKVEYIVNGIVLRAFAGDVAFLMHAVITQLESAVVLMTVQRQILGMQNVRFLRGFPVIFVFISSSIESEIIGRTCMS